MVNENLIKYFEEGIKLGNPINVLENSLIDAGWSEELVEETSDFIQKNLENEEKNEKKNYSLGISGVGNKKRPVGVIFISIIHWIIALGWVFLFAFVLTIFSMFFGGFDSKSAFLINLGLGIVVSSFPLIVGIGIWKGINGWRIVSIVFSAIFILFSIFVIVDGGFSAIILLGISLMMLLYLSFNKKCRNYFHKKN